MQYSPVAAKPLGFAPLQPFGVYPWQAYVQPGDGHWSTPGMHRVAAPSATLGRGNLLLLIQLFPKHPIYFVEHTALGAQWRITCSLCLPYMMGRGLLFQVWCHQIMWATLNLWWALNLVIPVWWLGIRLISLLTPGLQSSLLPTPTFYPGFTGKVSSLTHFPLELGCEDYAFLDQAVADFAQGLDSILTDSLETLELDTSLEDPDAITSSSVSSGFLCSVSTVSDNSEPQLAPSIWTHKLWCQARPLLAPVSLATKMLASKLICFFSSHTAAFGFWASTIPNNISLISANRKADQSLSDFQTGVGAAAHATLDTEQLISHLWVALLDTLSSLPKAEGDVIPVSEVHELLLQIYDILDKAVSKWVGNSTHILAHLFNSVSRQHHEVWAPQFPFLHSL